MTGAELIKLLLNTTDYRNKSVYVFVGGKTRRITGIHVDDTYPHSIMIETEEL